jgi:phosphatidylserine decarboxylase
MRIAPEGWPVLLIMLAILVGLSALAGWLSAAAGIAVASISFLLFLWALWFFRDPIRHPPSGAGLVISPADGKVIKIDRAPLPPELRSSAGGLDWGTATNPGAEPQLERIAIFLNLFNVHVNRVPVAGRIVSTAYVPGTFVNASFDKASTHNERSLALLRDPQGRGVAFVQIAGLVARRIVNHLRPGQDVSAGERFGLIRFGSRAEVFLPAGTPIAVRIGDHVVAGETILASLATPPATPAPVTTPAHSAANSGASL